jgi:hypothetical protein
MRSKWCWTPTLGSLGGRGTGGFGEAGPYPGSCTGEGGQGRASLQSQGQQALGPRSISLQLSHHNLDAGKVI